MRMGAGLVLSWWCRGSEGRQNASRGEACGARLKSMNARVDNLLDEVLGLPAEERSALAVALLDSLETADEATVSQLWRAEVNQRRAQLRAGQVQTAPWAQVRQRLSSL
jgi:putative addiction module component (TIGR02574 family)